MDNTTYHPPPSVGGSAQFAIAVDKFPHGAWWHANYHPRISGDVQSIKLTRSILDGNEVATSSFIIDSNNIQT